ncbi:MAG: NUDIX domain-containing protein [Firmicutes bacterium]|nr:NUDIX domain-containing protein [Bacillota bacterium]
MRAKTVLGVGGVVVRDGRVLMVQHNYGELDGCWLLPGGHVQEEENLDAAVEREVLEETSIRAKALGVVAVRSKLLEEGRLEVYIAFLMEYLEGEPRCEPSENQAVAFYTWSELEKIKVATPLSRTIIQSVLKGECREIKPRSDFRYDSPAYRLYL